MADCLPCNVDVVWMDYAQGRRAVWGGDVTQSCPGYVREALVDIGWCPFTCRAPDQSGHGVDKLLKAPLTLAQCFLGANLIVDVERNPVPLHDRSVVITPRLHPALRPAITIFLAPAEPHYGAVASFETLQQRALHLGSVVWMNQFLQQLFDAWLLKSLEV